MICGFFTAYHFFQEEHLLFTPLDYILPVRQTKIYLDSENIIIRCENTVNSYSNVITLIQAYSIQSN
ncbi:hypothetical protein FHW36_105169 [Chitinophaga polysaccharea]|uniref:Uncharacterized protein n=1 Tax=Chitinophaga polysaccharea TaxID=1293035 RepID=A0A561PNQ1_9BACT|nr:hypothetical protein FHW36_105169 [Chitinophaga polysaccharea]